MTNQELWIDEVGEVTHSLTTNGCVKFPVQVIYKSGVEMVVMLVDQNNHEKKTFGVAGFHLKAKCSQKRDFF